MSKTEFQKIVESVRCAARSSGCYYVVERKLCELRGSYPGIAFTWDDDFNIVVASCSNPVLRDRVAWGSC